MKEPMTSKPLTYPIEVCGYCRQPLLPINCDDSRESLVNMLNNHAVHSTGLCLWERAIKDFYGKR